MSGQLTKRQKARTERELQDLVKSVPGNDACADCQAQNPGWASWNLGIFLCMRCAALHRKLGTHITKVKSLTMDSWSFEQVERMKYVGNLTSNRIYNPQNIKVPITSDANGTDIAMEIYIRKKYQEKAFKTSQRSGVNGSDFDDQPPPLPPKTGTRFGFRPATTFPCPSKQDKEITCQSEGASRPDLQRRKTSQVFGISIGRSNKHCSTNSKLHNVSFTDQWKNLAVLKGLERDQDRSIETPVCLGGDNSGELKNLAKLNSFKSASTSMIPTRLTSSVGLPVNGTSNVNSSEKSTNPFALLGYGTQSAQPQSSQSTGGLNSQIENKLSHQMLTSSTNNLTQSQPSFALEQTFQSMTLNKSQKPLFPNRTGPGFPGEQSSQVELHQKSISPPVPCLPAQYETPIFLQNSAELPPRNPNYNPFIQQSQQNQPTELTSNNLYIDTDYSKIHNPYPSQFHNYPTQQNHSVSYSNSVELPHDLRNPFYHQQVFLQDSPHPQDLPQKFYIARDYQFQDPQQQTRLVIPETTYRIDNQSILDLYNYPHLAPKRPTSEQELNQKNTRCFTEKTSVPLPVLSPAINSQDPFTNEASPLGSPRTGELSSIITNSRNKSQESLNIDVSGWMNGRHSPDAWRSISARSVK